MRNMFVARASRSSNPAQFPAAKRHQPTTMFQDPDFSGDSAIGEVKVQEWRKPVQWRRATQLHKQPKLFDTIQAENIRQGELGDCWLLAAIAVLADFPGHIMNIFEEQALSEDGRYTILLYDIKNGWEQVVIDDLIPCDKNEKPLFAQMEGESGSLWALLLEKAFAKFVGSYSNLISGSAFWAFQVLTGQMYQVHLSRKFSDGTNMWNRWNLKNVKEWQSSEAGRLQWRMEGMRGSAWTGPAEKLDDCQMFDALAAYCQANYAMSCSIPGDVIEEQRADGLLARHEYSLLQCVEAHGVRLVQVRNPWGRGGEWLGAWSDSSEAWSSQPEIAEDLGIRQSSGKVKASDDGLFWMPWDAFCDIFGKDVLVCPVTLPCSRNSQLGAEEGPGAGGDTSRGAARGKRCPQCRQKYSKSWVLLVDGSWVNLADGQSLCFLCLRATCRASTSVVQVAGVHLQPKLSMAPPRAPRRLEVCSYGASCYRRNPQHFYACFHPSLLPPAPICTGGCGRSAASGFLSCCRRCSTAPPDLEVNIVSSGLERLSGLYKAAPGRSSRGAPVFRNSSGSGWLWKSHSWMFAFKEDLIGGNSGLVASRASAGMPHLVEQWDVPQDGGGGWCADPCIQVVVADGFAEVRHDELCNARAEREAALTLEADQLLIKFAKRMGAGGAAPAVAPPPTPSLDHMDWEWSG